MRSHNKHIGGILERSFQYILFASLALLPFSRRASATEIPLSGSVIELDYGALYHHDSFSDTLTFSSVSDDGQSHPVTPVDAEVTCDCVQYRVIEPNDEYPDGALQFSFLVQPGEPNGRIEKVLYVFTNDAEIDLVRLVLAVDVTPQGQPLASSRSVKIRTVVYPADEDEVTQKLESEENPASSAVKILFFYSPGCQSCRRVKEVVIPRLTERFSDSVLIEAINTDDPAGFHRLLNVRKHYGDLDRNSPFYFYVGESAIGGRKNLQNRLDAAIQQALQNGETTFAGLSTGSESEQAAVRSVFLSLSFWTVVGAGLLDGINPCAFATIVFFISLLNYSGSTRRQVIIVGAGFTTAVFTVYLLLGLGAFRALLALSIYEILSHLFYGLTFLLLVVLFILSVRDSIRYYTRGGKTNDQLLQLSPKIKRRIHGIMKKGLNGPSLLLGSLGTGALVSLLEAACTGQVYLPTIVLVLKDPALRTNAIFYLVIYNLLFILPLALVFLLAYTGTTSDRFSAWSKRHFGATRLALSLLFLVLAVLMGLEYFQV